MKKLLQKSLLVLFLLPSALIAKEGMWIPMLLEKINADEMQAMGMRISADEIYSVNKSSLKDAIVLFGGGCTGEIISDKGLLLTNHHCGYRNIQKHSTVENDYLTDGFWAPDFESELPNPGLTAKRLEKMDDVTSKVLNEVTDEMKIHDLRQLEAIQQSDKTFFHTDISSRWLEKNYSNEQYRNV